MMRYMLSMSKKRRAYNIEVMNGAKREKAALASKMTERMATYIDIAGNRNEMREQYVRSIISLWASMIEKDTDQPLKWSDKLKATELMAQYVGMLEQSPHTTINALVVGDTRGASEGDLLQKLNALRDQLKLKGPPPSESASAGA